MHIGYITVANILNLFAIFVFFFFWADWTNIPTQGHATREWYHHWHKQYLCTAHPSHIVDASYFIFWHMYAYRSTIYANEILTDMACMPSFGGHISLLAHF